MPLRTIVGVIYLADIGRHDEAAVDYLKATELAPDAARYLGLASCAVRLKRFDLAIASLDKAMLLEPDGQYLLGIRRATKMQAAAGMVWTRTWSESPEA